MTYNIIASLRLDKKDKKGFAPIYIMVYSGSKIIRKKSIGHKVDPAFWNKESRIIEKEFPNSDLINSLISKEINGLNKEILSKQIVSGGASDPDELLDKEKANDLSFIESGENQIVKKMYGKLLKQFTIDNGTQQKDVAKRIGFSSQRVGTYYRGISEPPFEFLEKFRTEFGVDLKQLLEKDKKDKKAVPPSHNPIPVFNLDAKHFSGLDFFNHSDLIVTYIDISLYNDCFAAIIVSGLSMAPDYNPSDIIAIKRISDFETIPFGEPFFIITEEQRLLRYIYENDKKTFILKAANDKYGDMTIGKDKIKYLFQVKGKMTKL